MSTLKDDIDVKRRIWIENAAHEVGRLTADKNAAYGNSFAATGSFFSILFPLGIPPEKYTDALLMARIFDKLMRVASRQGDDDAMGESPYADIAGYGLLGKLKDDGK